MLVTLRVKGLNVSAQEQCPMTDLTFSMPDGREEKTNKQTKNKNLAG